MADPCFLQPCTNFSHIKERIQQTRDKILDSSKAPEEMIGKKVFSQTEHNKRAPSIEDEIFLELLYKKVYMNDSNSSVAPLPFRQPRPCLPNNQDRAVKCKA